MGVLLIVNRKAKLYGRRKKVYPFQFQQSGLVAGKHRTYFKKRVPFKVPALRRRKLNPVMAAPTPPVGFAAYKRLKQPKIKRAKVLPFKLRRAKRLYVIPVPPASVIPFKKPPRAKIKRMNNTRARFRRGKFVYLFPGVIVQNTAKRSTVRVATYIGIG